NSDGTVIRLGDIAQIHEQWQDTPDKQYYDGQPSVILNIDQTEDQDILLIADLSMDQVDAFNSEQTRVQARVIDDRTVPLRQRIELLTKNGMLGLLLVMIALGFFLNLRLSFWVAIAIPFSFAGMFIVANMVGITINVISLFGMIIVVGILVDDGIVVGENIFAHFERGKPALQAAVDGTREMVAPVMTSVATTMIVFATFFFIDGRLGKFMWQASLVVIASLAFSLVEAFLILPSHLAHSKALQPSKTTSAIRKRIDGIIQYCTHRLYAPVLRASLRNHWVTIMIPLALVFLTVGLIGGGFIGVTFFESPDDDRVPINISLVSGSQEAEVDSILAYIEQAAWRANERLTKEREDGLEVITGIRREIGSNDFGESGSHAGRLNVMLLDGEERQMDSRIIAEAIREETGPILEAQNITFGGAGRFGKAVSISLLGNDYAQLERARDLLTEELKEFSALKDVTNTDAKGRRELSLTLKPRALALGLTLQDIAGQVRQGFYGQEIQRIQRGRDEIRVWVRYRPEDRASLGQLDQMRIRTATGAEYPFSELAEYTIIRGTQKIDHLNRRREIKVEANQTNPKDDLPVILREIQTDVIPRVLAQVSDVRVQFEGQSREQAKMTGSMMIVFPVAIIAMFVLVVLVFRSYAQALIVFSLIPIGILGAAWGHGIQGLQISMLSMFGIIALSGIIINDSIVLVDQVNRNLRTGMSVHDAVYEAGLSRLRPILLTTLTTSLGLAPLILETSRQAQFLIPMAVSVAYGLMFGTFILLLILPAAILVLNSLRVRMERLLRGRPVTPEEVEPAIAELQYKAES
ncbi:MAG: efflux RND transporter permease subunit, partial [candidate division Zixibacteria bacterium]|nr:efflux RND transporter permease subunit [candidate division Zixibacteria bacterium]